MGELTKNNNAGKQSPGPVYCYQDEVKYKKVSILQQMFKILISFLSYSHQDGVLERLVEPPQTSLNMTFMKM